MDYVFRQARRSNAKPLIGIYARSGCGKTLSALLLARGFVGPEGRIGMIESEGGRGEIFQGVAGVGNYDVLPIWEANDFSPTNYGKAIMAAEQAKPDALIIDSASHEWESTGGVLDMADKNKQPGVLKWQQAKMDHTKHFMLKLLATPIPLVIVCMRARYPMEQRQKPGKAAGEMEWVRSTMLDPKQSDDILFEMLTHFWIDEQHRVHVTRYARDDMKPVIPEGSIITNETGVRLAAWTRGELVDTNPPAGRNTADVTATTAPGDDTRREDPAETLRVYADRQLARCTTAAHVDKVVNTLSDKVGPLETAPPGLWEILSAMVAKRRAELAPKADPPHLPLDDLPLDDDPPKQTAAADAPQPEWEDDER